MNRKQRVSLSVEQKLEYAKLMVNEGYTNQQNNKRSRHWRNNSGERSGIMKS